MRAESSKGFPVEKFSTPARKQNGAGLRVCGDPVGRASADESHRHNAPVGFLDRFYHIAGKRRGFSPPSVLTIYD